MYNKSLFNFKFKIRKKNHVKVLEKSKIQTISKTIILNMALKEKINFVIFPF